MPLENAQFINQLNKLWPLGTDGLNVSDDQHRVIKQAVQQSFPNIGGEVTATQDDLNTLTGAASVGSGLAPVATLLHGLYGIAAPNGYLLCDGEAIPPEYAELIGLIGPNTPDMRGYFVRGWSDNASIDPDGPRPQGDIQQDQFASHNHPIFGNVYSDNGNNGGRAAWTSSTTASGSQAGLGSNSVGGDETRPVNVTLVYIIKW
jgi:hypothetical protein